MISFVIADDRYLTHANARHKQQRVRVGQVRTPAFGRAAVGCATEQTAATRMSGCCSGFCRAPARSLVHDTETTAILLADGVDLANGRPAPGFQPRQLANPELVEQHPDTGLYR